MRVLFLSGEQTDYLADSLLHGLREVLGDACVDVPKNAFMYGPLALSDRQQLYGNGFTLWGLLHDDPSLAARRANWEAELDSYDLIVAGDIWRMWPILTRISRRSLKGRLVVVDGEDSPRLFPLRRSLMRNPAALRLAMQRARCYFKREWLGDHGPFPIHRRVRPIAFSIPAEKISAPGGERAQTFPRLLVDRELAELVDASSSAIGESKYLFNEERPYYDDLQKSRFGPTARRAGWDCMRHYEYAANGCVLCFRDLTRKPDTCAPHGLDTSNCLVYSSASELLETISRLPAADYQRLVQATASWISSQSTRARAVQFLSEASV